MPEAISTTKYARIGPQKLGLVADLVRGCTVTEAKRRLSFSPKKGAVILLKSLNSAVANAKQKGEKEDNLRITSILVGANPMIKRFRAGGRGSAKKILRRTSQLKVILSS